MGQRGKWKWDKEEYRLRWYGRSWWSEAHPSGPAGLDPRMFQGLVRGQATFGRRLYQRADERLNVAAGALLGQLMKLKRVEPKHILKQGVKGGEGSRRGQHAVYHLAEGPHVSSLVVDLDRAPGLVGDELGRHILRGALDRR